MVVVWINTDVLRVVTGFVDSVAIGVDCIVNIVADVIFVCIRNTSDWASHSSWAGRHVVLARPVLRVLLSV